MLVTSHSDVFLTFYGVGATPYNTEHTSLVTGIGRLLYSTFHDEASSNRLQVDSIDKECQESQDCCAQGLRNFLCVSTAIAGYASRKIAVKWGIF